MVRVKCALNFEDLLMKKNVKYLNFYVACIDDTILDILNIIYMGYK